MEDMVPWMYTDQYVCLRNSTTIPVCTGEDIYLKESFRPLIEQGGVSVIHPDILTCGGALELKKIAAQAEAMYIPFAPHNPSGPVANAATLQLAACCPNFCILEIMYSDVDYRGAVTDENLIYENGRIRIGDRPGLGIELNEEECLRHPYVKHDLRHYTGALTDIRPAKTAFYF